MARSWVRVVSLHIPAALTMGQHLGSASQKSAARPASSSSLHTVSNTLPVL